MLKDRYRSSYTSQKVVTSELMVPRGGLVLLFLDSLEGFETVFVRGTNAIRDSWIVPQVCHISFVWSGFSQSDLSLFDGLLKRFS